MPVYEIVTEPEVPNSSRRRLRHLAAARGLVGNLHLHHNQSRETRGEEGLSPVERQGGDALMQEVLKLDASTTTHDAPHRALSEPPERIMGGHVFG